MKKFRVLFMGTTDFAAAILQELLIIKQISVSGVVCQPDKPIGRNKKIIFSEVKKMAIENNLLLFQPARVGEAIEKFRDLKLDAIITCAYGQILPNKLLCLTSFPLNIHASALPNLRGGAPIHWAIINNFHETGLTFMRMSEKMDAGNIFVVEKVIISANDTYKTLKKKLINLGKIMLNKYLIAILEGKILDFPQIDSEATFGFNITRANELINWKKTASEISCLIRGLYDSPIAYTSLNNLNYKIYEVEIDSKKSKTAPGTIEIINKQGIHVATNDFNLIIKTIQPAAKTAINAAYFFGSKENPLKVGMRFFS